MENCAINFYFNDMKDYSLAKSLASDSDLNIITTSCVFSFPLFAVSILFIEFNNFDYFEYFFKSKIIKFIIHSFNNTIYQYNIYY